MNAAFVMSFACLRFRHLSVVVAGCLSTLSLAAVEEHLSAIPAEINSGQALQSRSLTLSPDGRWLIVGTNKGPALIDRAANPVTSSNLRSTWIVATSNSPMASWSPDGSLLAFAHFREGKSALSVWRPGDDTPRELLVMPRALFANLPLTWSPDGKTLYVTANLYLRWQKLPPSGDSPPNQGNNVYVGLSSKYGEEMVFTSYDAEYEGATALSQRSVILAIDVAIGKFGVVAKGNDVMGLFPSPDGRQLAVVQSKGETGGDYGAQRIADVFVVDLPPFAELRAIDLEKFEERVAGWSDHQGRRLRPVIENAQINPVAGEFERGGGTEGNPVLAWAPDSHAFAYATVGRQASGDVFVWERATTQVRNVTAMFTVPASRKGTGYASGRVTVHGSAKFGSIFNPLWLPDSSGLLVAAQGEGWFVPAAAGQEPRLLTAKVEAETIRFVPSANPAVAFLDAADGSACLVTKDRATRCDSVWRLGVAQGSAVKVADTGLWINRALRIDATRQELVFNGQTPTSSPNVFSLALQPGAAVRPVTNYRAQLAERVFPPTRELHWTTPDGYVAAGLLYLPDAASPTHQVPLMIQAMPGASESVVDFRARTGARFFDEDLYGMLQDGIAVLLPDVPMSDYGVYEGTMKQMVDGALAATDAAVATGFIDERRMAVVGRGMGGNLVNAVITQTDRFKTAVSVMGSTNWFSSFLELDRGPQMHAQGEPRFGKLLWEDPHRYADNSPIAYWDKVKTPLLIVHGEADALPQHYAWDAAKGLILQNKTTLVAIYRRIPSGENPEISLRIRGWLREYLFDEKPITQIAEQGSFFFGGAQAGDVPAEPLRQDAKPATESAQPEAPKKGQAGEKAELRKN